MLQQALEVVEAARKLSPRRVENAPGLWKFGCEPRHEAQRVKALGEALEAFDAASGAQNAPLIPVLRAIQAAVVKGIPMASIADSIEALDPHEVRDADSLLELKPQPGEIGPPDKVEDSSPVPKPAPRFGDPAKGPRLADKYMAPAEDKTSQSPELRSTTLSPKLVLAPAFAASSVGMRLKRYVDEIGVDADVALADAGEYSADAEMEMDAIGDRLSVVLGRHGLTPKLRILLAAYVNARNKASADLNGAEIAPRLGMQESGVMARVNAELALVEANPSLAYDGYDENLVRESKLQFRPR